MRTTGTYSVGGVWYQVCLLKQITDYDICFKYDYHLVIINFIADI